MLLFKSFNSAPRRQREVDFCEFEASLVCTLSFRSARATCIILTIYNTVEGLCWNFGLSLLQHQLNAGGTQANCETRAKRYKYANGPLAFQKKHDYKILTHRIKYACILLGQ